MTVTSSHESFGLALALLAPQIDLALVDGSVAKQQDTAHSDIDAMIVSAGLGYADVFGALEGAGQIKLSTCYILYSCLRLFHGGQRPF